MRRDARKIVPRRELSNFPGQQPLTAETAKNMGRPMGFEPTTTGITIRYSNRAAAQQRRGFPRFAGELFACISGSFHGVRACFLREYFPRLAA